MDTAGPVAACVLAGRWGGEPWLPQNDRRGRRPLQTRRSIDPAATDH